MRRDPQQKKRIVYDPVLKRPGCILLQVLMGGTVGTEDIFMMGDWLVDPTPNMRVFEVTEAELELLKKVSRKKTDGNESKEADRLAAGKRLHRAPASGD